MNEDDDVSDDEMVAVLECIIAAATSLVDESSSDWSVFSLGTCIFIVPVEDQKIYVKKIKCVKLK